MREKKTKNQPLALYADKTPSNISEKHDTLKVTQIIPKTTQKPQTLRVQTVHWIDANFCVCLFLDSRDKYLSMLKLCRIDQRK